MLLFAVVVFVGGTIMVEAVDSSCDCILRGSTTWCCGANSDGSGNVAYSINMNINGNIPFDAYTSYMICSATEWCGANDNAPVPSPMALPWLA